LSEIDIFMDMDPAVYACGFASQSTRYVCVAEDEAGNLREAHFVADEQGPAGDKMKAWTRSLPEGTSVIDKQRIIIPEPLDHCLHIVRRHLDGIYHAVRELPVCKSSSVSMRGFLSGPDNYRNGIAKQAVYKGNRDPDNRPYHYEAIREYIRKYWDTVISRNCEADDLISIMAEQATTQHRDYVVVSIDKDLDQIPGRHYNPDKKVFYNQDRDSALLYFYQQSLSGDQTDNIPGCYKIGREKAEKFIIERAADWDEVTLDAEKYIWECIEREYERSTKRDGCSYAASDSSGVALETARLVYIQRAPRELWNPPGIGHGIIQEYDTDND
jgi:hypothetical protein